MMVPEIKELFVEELTLLKKIQEYVKEHSQGELERVEKVKLLLLYRIYSNLYSSLLLTAQVLKTGTISFYQLPIGLLLRCCFTDCLFALYIQHADKKRVHEELELRTIEYANSMLERKEVYRDQVKSTGIIHDDDFIGHMWEVTVEDNFLGPLTLDDPPGKLTVRKQSKLYDKPLKDLKLKDNCLIACIVRGETVIIPNGNSEIRLGDNVIVVTTHKNFDDLSDIFI